MIASIIVVRQLRTRVLAVTLISCTAPLCLPAQVDTARRLVIRGIARDSLGQPAPGRGVIRGIVRDSLGRPAPGSLIVLRRNSPGRRPNPTDSTFGKTAIGLVNADADGRFRFESLAPNTYELSLEEFFFKGEAGPFELGPNDSITVEVRQRIRYRVETPDSVRERRLAELAEARARWAAQTLSRYRLTATFDCLCFAKVEGTQTLEFRADSLVGIVEPSGRLRKPSMDWWKQFAVPTLFATAEEVIRDPGRVVKKIEYDPTFGFPTAIDTDAADWHTDGWYGQYVSAFRPIK